MQCFLTSRCLIFVYPKIGYEDIGYKNQKNKCFSQGIPELTNG